MEINMNDNVVDVSVQSITPYQGSHKTEGVIEMIKHSLQEYGFQQPIVVDKNRVIVAGNALFRAAVELGYETVPCIIAAHLTEEEANQYRIADNKTSEFATWNEKKLRQELSYLESPASMQYCFDNDILSMLGLNQKQKQPEKVLNVSNGEPKEVDIPKSILDKEFKNSLKSVEEEAVVKKTEYIEYVCSNCGQSIKVRRK